MSLPKVLPTVLLVMSPALLVAQSSAPAPAPATTRSAPVVPREMVPPAGKCRIWMDGVAPAQQPAPTDCTTALRQRPANGTIVFGPAERRPAVNGFGSRPARDSARTTRERAKPARDSVRTAPSRAPSPASSPAPSPTPTERRPPRERTP